MRTIVIGSATVSGCAGDDGEVDPEEPDRGSVISGASVDCAGALNFTIAEAAEETLSIRFTNPSAPSANQDLGSVSFPVTTTGTFQVQIELSYGPASIYATITSEASGDTIAEAAAYDCRLPEAGAGDIVSGLSVSCAGVVSFTLTDELEAGFIRIFDPLQNPQATIASEELPRFLSAGAHSYALTVPSGEYDQLLVRLQVQFSYVETIAWASVTDCLEDEEPVSAVVRNLSVDCNGLVTFDLETSEPVVLDVSIFIPAAAPGYRDAAQLSAESGPQQVQFDLPVRPYEWGTSVSLGAEWLADAIVQGCPMQPLNTLPGSDVTVPVAGGTVTFENVLEPGETFVTQLDPEFAPPLPAAYDGQLVIMVDISTTAVIAARPKSVCQSRERWRPIAANVRLLHFENGAWVDITSSRRRRRTWSAG